MSTLVNLAIFGLGPVEIGVIGVVALLLFGRRLPEVMRGMGRGIVEFKRGLSGIDDDINAAAVEPPRQPESKPAASPVDDYQKTSGDD